jgi:hypothetical protein
MVKVLEKMLFGSRDLLRKLVLTLILALSLTTYSLVNVNTLPSANASDCGWAMINSDGVSGAVLVGDCAGSFLAEWDRLGLTEGVFINYGCKLPCRFVIQTLASETGNVAGYSSSFESSNVTYDSQNNSFIVTQPEASSPTSGTQLSTPSRVVMVIKDGVATDSSGRSFSTGTGISTTTTLSQEQYSSLISETNRLDNASTQKSLALTKSRILALETPGLERCVKWFGYLEKGEECSLATSADSTSLSSHSLSSSIASDTATAVISVDTGTSVIAMSPTTTGSDSVPLSITVKQGSENADPKLEVSTVNVVANAMEVVQISAKVESDKKFSIDVEKYINKLLAIAAETNLSKFKLPSSRLSQESSVSLTPLVCSVEGLLVQKKSKGVCTISYTIVPPSGNTYTVEKTFTFKR